MSAMVSIGGGGALYLASVAWVASQIDGRPGCLAALAVLLTALAHTVAGFLAMGGKTARRGQDQSAVAWCATLSACVSLLSTIVALVIAWSFPVRVGPTVATLLSLGPPLLGILGCVGLAAVGPPPSH